MLGNAEPRAAVPGEVIPGHDFYDYADKYLDDACQLLAPAPLDDDLAPLLALNGTERSVTSSKLNTQVTVSYTDSEVGQSVRVFAVPPLLAQ